MYSSRKNLLRAGINPAAGEPLLAGLFTVGRKVVRQLAPQCNCIIDRQDMNKRR